MNAGHMQHANARVPPLDELLAETSRTFALCIPLLPPPLRTHVTVAYLLLRIADTYEDAAGWSPSRRIAGLEGVRALVVGLSMPAPLDTTPSFARAGDLRLLAHAPSVFDALDALSSRAAGIVRAHVVRSIEGMIEFTAMTENGRLRLRDFRQLRRYCYVVAGIVGEMLTELFLAHAPHLSVAAADLRRRAARFGEGLQLVNILKDAEEDAAEGRTYLPPEMSVAAVIECARRDLATADEYAAILRRAGAPRGVVEFVELPVALAHRALDLIEQHGAGARVSRGEVTGILQRITRGRFRVMETAAPARCTTSTIERKERS